MRSGLSQNVFRLKRRKSSGGKVIMGRTYICKVHVLDEDEAFREEIDTNGFMLALFGDGGALKICDPDWNEIEDIIRENKAKP
jgi:hypothetical protein